MQYLLFSTNNDIPKNKTYKVTRKLGYKTYWHVYIKRHWLRSWYPYTFQPEDYTTPEKVLLSFFDEYYGKTYTIQDPKNYPELLI